MNRAENSSAPRAGQSPGARRPDAGPDASEARPSRPRGAKAGPASAPSPSQEPARAYHHGNLREALIAAAIAIIETQGLEQLSVREAAKRAGVSPGAPFRHFASRAALLAAVAEQATAHLHDAVQARLRETQGQPALARFAAIGHAYLDWAARHPTHFRLISDRHAFDHASVPAIGQRNQAVRDAMHALLREALGEQVAQARIAQLQVMARALVYGLARMETDGHFPEWRLSAPDDGASAGAQVLDGFMRILAGAGDRI